MAVVKIITCKKWVNNSLQNCYYIATVQGDGFIYFNDDKFYRINIATGNQQIFYIDKQIWVDTDILVNVQMQNFNVTGAANNVNGSGSIAPGGQGVEDAIAWAKAIAEDDSYGYDQTSRWGPDYDCSSLIYEAFRVGGGFNLPTHSGYTGTMVTDFTNAGFTWYPGRGNDVSECMRGDILLNITDHVELYLGNQQNLGAHYNEYGNITGGEPGDQTGNEISVTGYYSFPWDGILRYEG